MKQVIQQFLIIALLTLSSCMMDNAAEVDHRAGFNGKNQGISYHPSHITVKQGDTIVKICERYNVKYAELLKINRLNSTSKLRAGQTLVLPNNKYYKVKPGDSLHKLAHMFKVEIGVIAKANQIKYPYKLKANQYLTIPANKVAATEEQALAKIDTNAYDSVPIPTIKSKSLSAAPTPPAGYKEPQGKPVTPTAAPKVIITSNKYIWPIKGKITTYFGPQHGGLRNDGLNIAADANTPIKAIASGTVAYAGSELKGYGNLVIIRHADDTMSAYAHQKDLLVHKGDIITQGQVIGHVGATGHVKTAQLHFAIRKGKKPVNPLDFLPRS